MKSVTFSDIVGAPRFQLCGLSPLTAYGLTLAIGMPLLVLALRAFDPNAPLAAIVLPVLAGLALPLGARAPGRLDVGTRFDARHLRITLDASLTALGYHTMSASSDRIRYLKAGASPWRAHSVSVRIHPHSLEIVGPIPTLRRLQALLTGPAAAPRAPVAAHADHSLRESVAGITQISDNAGRVAGMAE